MPVDFSSPLRDLRERDILVGATVDAILEGIDNAESEIGVQAAAVVRAHVRKVAGDPFTLGNACADALVAALPGEESVPLGERSRRFALAMRLVNGGECEVSHDERELIRRCATGYFTGSLIPARIAAALEPPSPSTP